MNTTMLVAIMAALIKAGSPESTVSSCVRDAENIIKALDENGWASL